MRMRVSADIDHFTQLGCEVSTPGAPEGYLHLPPAR